MSRGAENATMIRTSKDSEWEIGLQASSRKLQALIDACFRLSAINGINEGGIILNEVVNEIVDSC